MVILDRARIASSMGFEFHDQDIQTALATISPAGFYEWAKLHRWELKDGVFTGPDGARAQALVEDSDDYCEVLLSYIQRIKAPDASLTRILKRCLEHTVAAEYMAIAEAADGYITCITFQARNDTVAVRKGFDLLKTELDDEYLDTEIPCNILVRGFQNNWESLQKATLKIVANGRYLVKSGSGYYIAGDNVLPSLKGVSYVGRK